MGHFGDTFTLNFDTLIDFYTINNFQVEPRKRSSVYKSKINVFKILVHHYKSYIC